MKTPTFLLIGLLAMLALGACSKKDSTTPTPAAGGDYLDFTLNGKTYHSTLLASAIATTDGSLSMTGAADDQNTIVSVQLVGAKVTGPGVYQLKFNKSGFLDRSGSDGEILLDSKAKPARDYLTESGPAAINGTATITQLDWAKQQVSGTFTFTGGASYGTPTGTQTVTDGKFSFTVFH